MAERSNIVQITPFLPSSNIAASVAFYTDILGFTCFVNEDGYAYLERDRVGIRLLAPDGTGTASQGPTLAYIDVLDVGHIAEELRRALNSLPEERWSGPKDQSYGMRELIVRDPDGNIITFGQGIGDFASQWDYRQ